MNFQKWILLSIYSIGFLIFCDGNWAIRDAITNNNLDEIKNNLAIIHYEKNGQDMEKWDLRCHGLFIGNRLVVSTRHYINFDLKHWVNGLVARPIVSLQDVDLAIFLVDIGKSYMRLKICTAPKVGAKVFVPQVHGQRFFWKNAGSIVKISPDKIILKDFMADNGESGKPVFLENGELVGLIQLMDIMEKSTVLIPVWLFDYLIARP